MADPADLVREACAQLARYLPVLRRETPEPDVTVSAVPGMTCRPSAAPLPGNVPAIYALTGIDATARQVEGVLKYAAGARRGGPLTARGGSDGNTELALDAICGLFAAVEGDHDLERLVISELDRRLAEAQSVRAIDEAQQWRYVRGRPCPYCRCFTIRVLLDAAGRATGHVECHSDPAVRCQDGNGLRPAAGMGTDERGRPVLAWADGLTETAPDLDG